MAPAPVIVELKPGFIALMAGAPVIGIYASLHFGKVKRDRQSRR